MRKMVLRPDSSSYSSQDGDGVVRSSLNGGRGRYRRDKLGASKTVNASWTLTPVQYQYWRAFFVTGTKEGSLPFLCDLVGEDGCGPAEHECYFMPGSVSLPTQQGLMYVQRAVLEVKPLAHNSVLDDSIMDVFEASDGHPDKWFNIFDWLVNTKLPEALPDA